MNDKPLIMEGDCEIYMSRDDFDFTVAGLNVIDAIERRFRPPHELDELGHYKKLGTVRLTIEKLP